MISGYQERRGLMAIQYKLILQAIDVMANVLSAIAEALNGRRKKDDGNRSGKKK